jgi:hypothetical protein
MCGMHRSLASSCGKASLSLTFTVCARYIMRMRMDSCLTGAGAPRAPPLQQWKLEVNAVHAITFGGIGQAGGYWKCPNLRWPREACDTAWFDTAFVIGR